MELNGNWMSNFLRAYPDVSLVCWHSWIVPRWSRRCLLYRRVWLLGLSIFFLHPYVVLLCACNVSLYSLSIADRISHKIQSEPRMGATVSASLRCGQSSASVHSCHNNHQVNCPVVRVCASVALYAGSEGILCEDRQGAG